MSPRLDRAATKLTKALGRLNDDQGRVARGNARTAALAALRDLRAALDADYPVIPKSSPKRRKPRPITAEKLRKAGYIPLREQTFSAAVLASEAGIRLRFLPRRVSNPQPWCPAWVRGATSITELREAARGPGSRAARKRLEALARLGRSR